MDGSVILQDLLDLVDVSVQILCTFLRCKALDAGFACHEGAIWRQAARTQQPRFVFRHQSI